MFSPFLARTNVAINRQTLMGGTSKIVGEKIARQSFRTLHSSSLEQVFYSLFFVYVFLTPTALPGDLGLGFLLRPAYTLSFIALKGH